MEVFVVIRLTILLFRKIFITIIFIQLVMGKITYFTLLYFMGKLPVHHILSYYKGNYDNKIKSLSTLKFQPGKVSKVFLETVPKPHLVSLIMFLYLPISGFGCTQMASPVQSLIHRLPLTYLASLQSELSAVNTVWPL